MFIFLQLITFSFYYFFGKQSRLPLEVDTNYNCFYFLFHSDCFLLHAKWLGRRDNTRTDASPSYCLIYYISGVSNKKLVGFLQLVQYMSIVGTNSNLHDSRNYKFSQCPFPFSKFSNSLSSLQNQSPFTTCNYS